jgi:polyisoprenoid-binding protein YceI
MISKVRGQFTRLEGRLVTTADPLESSVTATIEIGSIDTANLQRDAHLRSADFFDAETYLAMTYTSTGLKPDGDGFLLEGDLTLKGITRQVPLTLEMPAFSDLDPFLPDPAAGARAGFTATGEVSRSDFGVGDAGLLPGGGVGLSDKVQIILEIQAALQT